MKLFKIILIILLALFLNSCATQKFYMNGTTLPADAVPDYEKRIHFFFYGVFQTEEIDVKKICGAKPAAQIITYYKFWEIFVGSMLHGIWRPSTYKIYCEK